MEGEGNGGDDVINHDDARGGAAATAGADAGHCFHCSFITYCLGGDDEDSFYRSRSISYSILFIFSLLEHLQKSLFFNGPNSQKYALDGEDIRFLQFVP